MGHTETRRPDVRPGAVIFLRFFIFVAVCVGLRYLLACLQYVEVSEQYPAFDVHARAYHSTKEIHTAVRLDNALNPFYTWFDLSPAVEPASMRLYGYGPVDDNMKNYKLRVFVLCNQHARETVTGELCYHLVRLLQLQTRDDEFTTTLEEQTLRGVAYWVVPVGNPWGRQMVEANLSQACLRKNANGVDLNRNYPSPHARPYPTDSDEEEAGPEPLSEYESRDVAAFAAYVDPHLVVNVHSGGADILLPYDGDDEAMVPYYSRLMSVAKHARKGLCPECGVGQASLLYPPADGTFVDYMVSQHGTPLAYTLEIFSRKGYAPDSMEGPECQLYFNPDAGDELARTLRTWMGILLRITEKISVSIKS